MSNIATIDEARPYCIRVVPSMIDKIWDKCVPFLDNPDIGEVEYIPVEDLKQLCLDNMYQLWILMQGDELTGCFCTNIGEAAPGINIVNIFNLSGEGVRVWVREMHEKMVAFAKENNCKFYTTITRPGFSRFVPELKDEGRFYVCDITKGA